MAEHGADLRVVKFVPFSDRANRVADEYHDEVSVKIADELDKGWLIKVPFDDVVPDDQWAIAPLQVVVEPSKRRLVTDYSDVLRGMRTGVNAWVDMDSLGQAFMHRCVDLAKAVETMSTDQSAPMLLVRDLSKTFRRVGVRQEDIPMLHTKWNGDHMWDTRLPFGHAASSHWVCKLTRAISEAVSGVLRGKAICLCYVDDFILVCKKPYIQEAEQCLVRVLGDMNLDISTSKATESGTWSTSATWIGFVHDTITKTHALSAAKMSGLLSDLKAIQGSSLKVVKFGDLRSLVGRMNHAANVCMPARAFLRTLYTMLSRVDDVHADELCLDGKACADIDWWVEFLPKMPLVARMVLTPSTAMPCVATDASLDGGGAVLYSQLRHSANPVPRWRNIAKIPADDELMQNALAFKFVHRGMPADMATLEAVAACIAISEWVASGAISFSSDLWLQLDNDALVTVLRLGRAKDVVLNEVVKKLLGLCVSCDIRVYPFHVYSQDNVWADKLSRAPDGDVQALQLHTLSASVAVQWMSKQNWHDWCL